MKIDSIMSLIGLLDSDVKFNPGEDRVLKLFKRTMWASIALETLDWVGFCLFPNQKHRFFKYLYKAGQVASALLFPFILLTIAEAARLKDNYNRRIPANQ